MFFSFGPKKVSKKALKSEHGHNPGMLSSGDLPCKSIFHWHDSFHLESESQWQFNVHPIKLVCACCENVIAPYELYSSGKRVCNLGANEDDWLYVGQNEAVHAHCQGHPPKPDKQPILQYFSVPEEREVRQAFEESSWEFPHTVIDIMLDMSRPPAENGLDGEQKYYYRKKAAWFAVKSMEKLEDIGGWGSLPKEMKILWLETAGLDTSVAEQVMVFENKKFVIMGQVDGNLERKITQAGGVVWKAKSKTQWANTDYLVKGQPYKNMYGKTSGPGSKKWKEAKKKKWVVTLEPQDIEDAIVSGETPTKESVGAKRKASKGGNPPKKKQKRS